MDSVKKRNLFWAVTALLVAVLIIVSIVILAKGPRDSSVELVSKSGSAELTVNDMYDGQMTIPYFDIPTSSYKPDSFLENKGVITYEGGDSFVGINVNSKRGDIDWQQVKDSGVDYAMIRVGWRADEGGKIAEDEKFEDNIKGATEAGLPVGVYFYSKAVTDAEAEEEATFVLEKIRTYNVTYPVAIYWEYDTKDDGTPDESKRTVRCNGDQVTGFIDTFCKKIEATGRTASFYCDKSMGYTKLDLSKLSDYDMWYAEFRSVPSFYYNYTMWQYTKSGTVPGIEGEVPINLSLKKYG